MRRIIRSYGESKCQRIVLPETEVVKYPFELNNVKESGKLNNEFINYTLSVHF